MDIRKLLTPYNHNAGNISRIKYIVLHYVGALGSAEANCKYYASGNIGASAHYYVNFDGSIWQSVEDKDIAWHCGAKSYLHPECRNANSIGIELCVRNKGSQAADSKDWYFEDATVQAAAELTKRLMQKYKVPADHVIRHFDVTGKTCPNPYVYNHTKHTWNAFKAALTAQEPVKTGWDKDSQGKYRYRKINVLNAANEWLVINHHWYLFGKDGIMLTGWQRWNGSSVIGAEDAGDWYYLDDAAGGPLEGACWHTRECGAQEIWTVQ